MDDRSEFDWANLPADLVRAFARALDPRRRPDTDRALELLRPRVPTPDFFRDFEVRYVAANSWLPNDPVALDHVYATLQGGVIPTPGRGRQPSERRKLAAVRRVVDPPVGSRQSQSVRDVLAHALMASGGALAPGDSELTLRPFNVMSTRTTATAPSLHPHQERVVSRLRSAYRRHGNDLVGVVVMPTGAGKTVTAVHWLLDDPVRKGTKVLWVTHREELLNQTARTFVRSAGVLGDTRDRLAMRLIGGGYGSATTLPDRAHDVVVATIGALAHNPRAVRSFLDEHPCVVVFDEAHHAVARTWRDVLQLAREHTDDAVVGLTATPTRMSRDERRLLGRLFEHTLAEVTLAELIPGGYLAEARMESVPTSVDAEALADEGDLDHLRRYGELSPRLASRLANNAPRNRIIIDTYRRGPRDGDGASYGQTIVFAVDIDHAHLLARDFAADGVPAGALTASISTLYLPDRSNGVRAEDMPRSELLERFRSGSFPVLVNIQVLTEGVDVPTVTTAFLARPTGSEVLMSQMVGRALRGEKVGGTPHAYLVSFRDHWERFPDWMEPIRLPGMTDLPAPIEERAVPPRAPGDYIDLDLWRTLLFAAGQEVQDRLPATVEAQWSAVPVGLFAFEVELPIDDESSDEDELEARHVDLFVYAHDEAGFAALSAAITAGAVGPDAELWVEHFFAETPAPLPNLSRLDLLAHYVAAEGAMPRFIRLDNRDSVDPRRIARHLVEADARREEREAAIATAYETNPAIVDAYYGGPDGLRREVLKQFLRLEAGDPESFDELRVPTVRGADRVDHTFGVGAHNLDAVVERVRTDPTLFSPPLPAPAGGIAWTKRALGSLWADYSWSDDEAPRIRVNVLLDSADVDDQIIEFLVYHELLHHQDYVEKKTDPRNNAIYSPHDRDFREREARHPALVKANAWIDTFHERLAAIDEEGRPVAN